MHLRLSVLKNKHLVRTPFCCSLSTMDFNTLQGKHYCDSQIIVLILMLIFSCKKHMPYVYRIYYCMLSLVCISLEPQNKCFLNKIKYDEIIFMTLELQKSYFRFNIAIQQKKPEVQILEVRNYSSYILTTGFAIIKALRFQK